MSKLKKEVKEDFVNKVDIPLSFDASKLEDNEPIKKKFNKKWLFAIVPSATVLVLILGIGGVAVASMLQVKTSIRLTRKQYSAEETAVIESNTFKRLNSFEYPSLTGDRYQALDSSSVSSFNSFANKIYQSLSYEDNASFSPVNLFSLLSVISMGTSSTSLTSAFDSLFDGMNENKRTSLYGKIINNNTYLNSYGTSILHNGAFVDYNLGFSNPYLQKLTNNYFEAFSLNYKSDNDIGKMIDWVNDSMQEEGFLKKDDLKINGDEILYLFSTFIFSNQWQSKYYESDNTTDYFHLDNGEQVQTTFMSHSYRGEYYDYAKYVSVYDYYQNANSVQYIIPKSVDDNIYDILGDSSFLEESGTLNESVVVNMTAPIFTSNSLVDFKPSLESLGLGSLFSSDENNLNEMFVSSPVNSYIKQIKQKNEVSFTIDGTKIKSLAIAGGASSAAPAKGTLEVKLNQPFIYVIRDSTNIPLYIGHFDNPAVS